ncbi:hypothetical protein ACFOVU_03830 [Nocardiopsis sediminis]|uniref:SalK n=1 Tax=Nocardiopsis sediminis TaxID=1778267 RepID=A0ABV8FI66_9ACTN
MPASTVSPELARSVWKATEPLHSHVYFAPQRLDVYAAVGLEPKVMGYFASRSAPLGAVGPEAVAATFYNFNPELIASVIPQAWGVATPDAVVGARTATADLSLRALLGEEAIGSAELAEAAELARTAAEGAAHHAHGRPLFAGLTGLGWPKEPHLVLWHAVTLLREFRGDGHIAALLAARIGPLEALVTYAASGASSASGLRKSRGWPQAAWDAGVAATAERGLVDVAGPDGALSATDEGARLRAEVEARTDELARPAFEALGPDGCERLITLASPFTRTVREAGILPGTRKR